MATERDPRLVLRFAVASLVAFVLAGAAGLFLMSAYARDRAERVGEFHARFVVDSVLAPTLQGIDLSTPLRGADYDAVWRAVRDRVLSDGRAVRVKIWRPDGTIVFSDEGALVGLRFAEERGELAEVLEDGSESGISDLEAEENEFERDLAGKLFFTYAPLTITPGGPPVAVAEIYQDYAFIQNDIDALVNRMALMLVVGLAVLYASVLPIALGASRELRRRNDRLNELLQREQGTVAELRDLNQKMDDFVAAASHELRTPLTSIIGYLSSLQQDELANDPAVRGEFLDAAGRQAKRLQRLIANLLTAGRLEETTRPVTIELVDLAATLGEIASELDATSRIRLDLPAEASVPTDRDRVTQILTNLLENALKYSPADAPVDAGANLHADGVRIWVTDAGPGIDAAEHEAIFERFHQVDQSATRRHGGVGLGLHIARSLAEELGGRIEVASAPGRGSTFTLALPIGDRLHVDGERAPTPAR